MNIKTLFTSLLTAWILQGTVQAQPVSEGNSKPLGPGEVITQKIRAAVDEKLKQAGATYETLQVKVAVKRDSATPFKVIYRGLRNFPADNAIPPADGEFIMRYAGAGTWKGKLGSMAIVVPVGTSDNIDVPFVDDPQVLGAWQSVDFVADPSTFDPSNRAWKGKLYLRGLTFLEGGKMPEEWWTWTQGLVLHQGDKTASRYEIRKLNGVEYLFFEWKSGDVTIAGMKPHYYVLRKKAPESSQNN